MKRLEELEKEEEERQSHPLRTEIAIDESIGFYREIGYSTDIDVLKDENVSKKPYPEQREIKKSDAVIEASDFYRFYL